MIYGSCAKARLKRLVSRVLMEIVPEGPANRVNNASGKRFQVFVDCNSVRIEFCLVRIPEPIKQRVSLLELYLIRPNQKSTIQWVPIKR